MHADFSHNRATGIMHIKNNNDVPLWVAPDGFGGLQCDVIEHEGWLRIDPGAETAISAEYDPSKDQSE